MPPSRPSDAVAAPPPRGSILILGFVGFVTAFGAHIVAVNLPVYAEQVGVGVAIIGLLIAIYDLAEIVAKPLFGALADRRGMKQTMLADILVFTMASLAYPWIDPRFLVLIRFVQGVGAAAFSAVSLALVGAYAPHRRGRAYGLYNAIKGTGYVVSPVIGGAIVWKSHFGAIFLATAAVGGIAFLLSLWLPNPQFQRDAVFADEHEGFSLALLGTVVRQRGLWPWFVVTVVNMFFVGILFGFLPVHVHGLGYDPLAAGLLLTAVAASYLLAQPVAGTLADRVGPSRTIHAGMLLSGVTIVVLPFVRDVPLLVVSILGGHRHRDSVDEHGRPDQQPREAGATWGHDGRRRVLQGVRRYGGTVVDRRSGAGLWPHDGVCDMWSSGAVFPRRHSPRCVARWRTPNRPGKS
jgi:MFS family permease